MNGSMQFLEWFHDLVWKQYGAILITIVAIYYTIRLRGIQLHLPKAFKFLFAKNEENAQGDLSHYATLALSVGTSVGVGNIIGVTVAIQTGGPGAIFWMWVGALICMALRFGETLLTIKYRVQTDLGLKGGPMYYLEHGLGMRKLACLFAFLGILATFGSTYNQTAWMADNIKATLNISSSSTALILGAGIVMIIASGTRVFFNTMMLLVPLMILVYCGVSIMVICVNLTQLPLIFHEIISHAFQPHAAVGGFFGATIFQAIKEGFSHGLFSHESGLGTTSIFSARTQTNEPTRQALVSMLQPCIDTFGVCTITAFVILINNHWSYQSIPSSLLAAYCIGQETGPIGKFLVSFSLIMFVLTTILGWWYYGERCMEYLFKPKHMIFFHIFFITSIVTVAIVDIQPTATKIFLTSVLTFVFPDLLLACIAIPNLFAMVLLAGKVRRDSLDYFKRCKLTHTAPNPLQHSNSPQDPEEPHGS